MREAIVAYLPWLLSAVTIYMTVLAGNKTRWAWAVGLVNQALWLGWIIASESWGLIPMNLALWIVYTRNHVKWNKPPAPSISLGSHPHPNPGQANPAVSTSPRETAGTPSSEPKEGR